MARGILLTLFILLLMVTNHSAQSESAVPLMPTQQTQIERAPHEVASELRPPYLKEVARIAQQYRAIRFEEEKRPDPYHYMVQDFLNAAYSSYLWFEHIDQPLTSDALWNIKTHLKAGKDQDSFPKHGVLNKWKKPIKVVLRIVNTDLQSDQGSYAFLIKDIKRIIAKLNAIPNLDISYSDSLDANVYIIVDAKSHIMNAFKNLSYEYGEDQHNYEFNISGGVRFTPESNVQVEGFFVPNNNNNIVHAACYLKPNLINEKLTKSLLSECMIRILGFPENIKRKTSILSEWNVSLNNVSKNERISDVPKANDAWVVDINNRTKDFQVKVISDRDIALISMMYCDSIKVGMDKYQAAVTLFENVECTGRNVENAYFR